MSKRKKRRVYYGYRTRFYPGSFQRKGCGISKHGLAKMDTFYRGLRLRNAVCRRRQARLPNRPRFVRAPLAVAREKFNISSSVDRQRLVSMRAVAIFSKRRSDLLLSRKRCSLKRASLNPTSPKISTFFSIAYNHAGVL